MTRSNPGPIDPDLFAAPLVTAENGPIVHDISAPREGDPEKVYYEGSPLVRGNVGSLLLFFFIGALFIAAPFLYRSFNTAGEWPIWWVTLLSIVIGLVLIVAPIVFSRTMRYRISNYRIDYERGLLSKTIDTTELWHVDDIQFHQSLIDRILGVGTITVFASDRTSPSLPLRGIPRPREIFDAMKARIIAIKRSRGVIKMDV